MKVRQGYSGEETGEGKNDIKGFFNHLIQKEYS
jgi:hypothetical protein